MAGKQYLGKLARYPMGQNFRQNRSISHRYLDKCIFKLYTEIQDS